LKLLDLDEGVVEIANPLSSERAAMQTTLLAGLIENLKRAATRFLPGICQFEVGRTFHDIKEELPKEVARAAALLSGPKPAWVGETERQYDFYDLKGILEAFVLEYCGMFPQLTPVSDVPYLHPKRACRVMVGDFDAGVIGELHPSVLSKLKLPRGAVVFEIEIFSLWTKKVRSAAPKLPEFPPMTRDTAFVVAENMDAGRVLSTFREALGSHAESVRIFDVYTGSHVSSGHKSLAISVTYRALDRTLTDEEVDKTHNAAVAEVISKLNAAIR
jgi:phenylalanyl-tRNA synthetase beta chain